MLKKVKKWLGIEGVKVEVVLPEVVEKSAGKIEGTVKFSSMNAQTVSSIQLKLVEKYMRGRRKKKRTDEYLLAENVINQLIEVPAEETVELSFELPFDLLNSQMDQIEQKNFLLRGVVKAAKAIKSVKSEYRIEVEADVVGTALNPFVHQVINFQ